jgi:hypothetical protein
VTRVVVLRYTPQPGILARLELPGEGDVAVEGNPNGELRASTSSSFLQGATYFTPHLPPSPRIPSSSRPLRPALHLDTKRPELLPPFAPFPPWRLTQLYHRELPIPEIQSPTIRNRYYAAIAPSRL